MVSKAVAWKVKDTSKDEAASRDERHLAYMRARGRAYNTITSTTGARKGCGNPVWGGATRRMVSTVIGPSRQDEAKYVSVPGRYVPVGFDRYKQDTIDPLSYSYFRVAAWRVAVPNTVPGPKVAALLSRIFFYGPQSAGYVRMGDTLVPAILGPGDRMTLAESAIGYQAFPLSE